MNPESQSLKSTKLESHSKRMNSRAFRSNVVLSSLVASLGVSAIVSAAAPAGAVSVGPPPVSFGFGCISNNIAADCAIGESQLKATVSQYSPTQVLFKFFNIGSAASSITDVYFEDTSPESLLSIAGIFNYTSGVNFSEGASPKNLPSGNNVNFLASFSADSNNPTQPSGVNPGETLGILFNVKEGFTSPFNAVITDLQTGSLRVGLRVQGYAGGGSESFVNEGVPEPLTIVGSGVALGLGGFFQRKMSKLQKKKS